MEGGGREYFNIRQRNNLVARRSYDVPVASFLFDFIHFNFFFGGNHQAKAQLKKKKKKKKEYKKPV